MNTGTKSEIRTRQYLPIYLDSLRAATVPDFDLYLESGSQIVLYRAASQPFTEQHRALLLEHSVSRLLIMTEDQAAYQRYLESNLDSIVSDTSIKPSIRAGIVYDSAKLLVEDLFSRREIRGDVNRCKELVRSTVGFILTDAEAFHQLLDVMATDYNTYTHSVNVCTLSLALAQFSGIKDPKELKALGTGALLHDIGKTRIPEAVLNKVEPLTDAEREMIRNHPDWGYEIVKESAEVHADAYYPILQHHERNDSTGYPRAVGSDRIHTFGKMTAIADVFDAMTTNRAYRSALSAYDALKQMFGNESGYDRVLLEQFTKMLAPPTKSPHFTS